MSYHEYNASPPRHPRKSEMSQSQGFGAGAFF